MTRLDTTEIPSCGDVIDDVTDRLGSIDVFVNYAGTGDGTMFSIPTGTAGP